MAGASRIEIFTVTDRYNSYPGVKSAAPLQVANETTSESAATTAGSRITIVATGNGGRRLIARVSNSEDCYMAVGSDPTASNTALAYLLKAAVPLEIEVTVGQKFSFRDVA